MLRLAGIITLIIVAFGLAVTIGGRIYEPVSVIITVKPVDSHVSPTSIRIIIGVNATSNTYTLTPLTQPTVIMKCSGPYNPVKLSLNITRMRLKPGLNILANLTVQPPCKFYAKLINDNAYNF
jgi:hypothetical protein